MHRATRAFAAARPTCTRHSVRSADPTPPMPYADSHRSHRLPSQLPWGPQRCSLTHLLTYSLTHLLTYLLTYRLPSQLPWGPQRCSRRCRQRSRHRQHCRHRQRCRHRCGDCTRAPRAAAAWMPRVKSCSHSGSGWRRLRARMQAYGGHIGLHAWRSRQRDPRLRQD